MDKKNCIDQRVNASLDILGEKKDVSEVIIDTLSLLEQFQKENQNSKHKIIKQLEKIGASYTYGDEHKIIIDLESGKISSILSQEKRKNLEELQNTYNEKVEREQEISLNIEKLKTSFMLNINNQSRNLVKNTMEQVGIQILEAQEKERNRIARDLHDSVVQNLTNLVHKLEFTVHIMDEDVIGAKLDLQIMMKYVRDIINDIREIIYNLRPMNFDDLGIVVAIQRYIDVFSKNTNVVVNLKVDSEISEISNPIINLTLLRIIQESCSNAFRHGAAKKIDIQLRYVIDDIELVITDDGSGFDVEKLNEKKRTDNSGFGLSIMRERVYLLSGDMYVTSENGKGTIIKVDVPTGKC